MRSLKVSLLAGTVLGTTAVLLLAGVFLFVAIRKGVLSHFDQSLQDKARSLVSAVEQEGSRLDLDFDDVDMAEFAASSTGGYAQIWGPDGEVLFRSASLKAGDLERRAGESATQRRWVRLPSGREGRAVQVVFLPKPDNDRRPGDRPGPASPGPGPVLTLVLARDAEPVRQTLTPIIWSMALVGLLAVAVASGVLWLVVRRALRPVAHVTGQIGRMSPGDLSGRIDPAGLPRELAPIVHRFNDLLDRLDLAFEREKQFTSDAAHELRTPLSALRATMEVSLSSARIAPEYAESLREALPIVLQMQSMVDNLLSLARIEAGQMGLEARPVVLADLVHATFKPLREAIQERRLTVKFDLSPGLALRTDASLLGLVLRNIFENAMEYAPPDSTIAVMAFLENGSVRVSVANPTTLTAGQVARVFDRYWRASDSRSQAGARSGLGLSLVSKAVRILGGQVDARVTDDRQFVISISLPAGTGEAVMPPGYQRYWDRSDNRW